MKAVLITAVLMCLIFSGCTTHRRGTRTVTTTWNNKMVLDNPTVELVKAFKGTPTGNTGTGFQVTRYSSWTESNMPKHWR